MLPRCRYSLHLNRLVSKTRFSGYLPSCRHLYASIVASKGTTSACTNAALSSSTPVVQPSLPNNRIELRPYQNDCIDAVLKAFNEGKRSVAVSLATGSGKTVIFTELIGLVEPPSPQATCTLILAHRRELVEQAAKQCKTRYPDKTVEIEMGNIHASGLADITIASIQSIHSGNRIAKFDSEMYKLVLVDEAHHIVSSSYLDVLQHFGVPDARPELKSKPALMGVSATLGRLDGVALGKVLHEIVYHQDYIDMIEGKWLSDIIFTTVSSSANLKNVRQGANNDFRLSDLSAAVNQERVNAITVQAWHHRARDRKSTIVFCVDLAHVDGITKAFKRTGIDARFVTGDTPKKRRSETLDAFKRREFPVLVNCGVFTEGTDIPNIDCVLLARPTKSRNLLVQMIGRGMRKYEGKANCHIIDMVASLQTGIVTTPTLYGLDPTETVVELNPDQMRNLRKRKQKAEEDRLKALEAVSSDPLAMQTYSESITFTDYDNVADLIEDTAGERKVRQFSTNAWVHVGPSRFVLMNGANGDWLTIELHLPEAGEKVALEGDSPSFEDSEMDTTDGPGAKIPADKPVWRVTVTNKLSNRSGSSAPHKDKSKKALSPFARPRPIAYATNLEAAIRGADTYANKHFVRFFISFHLPGRHWRHDTATSSQIDYLNKFREPDRQLRYGDITKGQAGDMIVKIKFGAKGRIKQNLKQRRGEERTKESNDKWEKIMERERVKVGPLLRS